MSTSAPTVDYSGFTSGLQGVITQFAPEITTIAVAGLAVFALFWGIPKLQSFFKKTAK